MEHDPKAWLEDMLRAGEDILAFTKGLSLSDYRNNNLVKAGVERKFLVIGESLVRIRDEAPLTADQISDISKIIGFRNVLVHGYDVIDDATVWSAIIEKLPSLLAQIRDLI